MADVCCIGSDRKNRRRKERRRQMTPERCVVVITYDFDPTKIAYECENRDEAVNYMEKLYRYYLEAERNESPFFDENLCKCDKENGSAVITFDSRIKPPATHMYFEVVEIRERMI